MDTEKHTQPEPHQGGFLPNRKRLGEALVISLLFFVVEFILVHFHELWGDEVHSWAIAGSSHSLGDLINNTRYEGHPLLWYLLLFLLEKFTHNIFYMQVLHICIATSTVFVFCFFSPLGLLKNVLFCFGYFFAYEYSIISRNYAIEVVLLFLCAGIYSKHHGKHLWVLSILFFLLFQTNFYAVIIGVPFYCYIIWNLYKVHSLRFKTIFISGLIVLSGTLISVFSMKPPTNSGFAIWNTELTLYNCAHVLSTLFNSYFPLPRLNSHFWCTNILNILPQHIFIQASLSIVLLVFMTILFKRDKKILFLFFAGTIGILVFTYIKYFGNIRHHGHLFLLFVLCYWLYSSENEASIAITESSRALLDKFNLWLNKYFIMTILLVQLAAACYANAGDVVYVFSNDMAVATYLKENSLDKLPILGDGDYSVSGIAGIMNKDIYFMRPKYWGRYITMDSTWGHFITFSVDGLMNAVDSISEPKKSDVIVILSYPFNPRGLPNWTLLKAFDSSIISEDYLVFRVHYLPPNPIKLNANGELLLSKGYVKEAMSLFRKAIYYKPDYSEAYMNLADCYNNGVNNFKEASVYIDSAIKYAPDNINIVFDKGAILFNSGDHKNALTFFKETLTLNPQFLSAYFSVARCYIAMQDNNDAISYLKMLLKIDSKNVDAYRMLSQCYKNKGDVALENTYDKKAQEMEKGRQQGM